MSNGIIIEAAGAALCAAKRVLDNLKSERTRIQLDLEQAVRDGKTDLLPELRHRMFQLEERDIHAAEIKEAECSVALYEAEAAEGRRLVDEARHSLDDVCSQRAARIEQLRRELLDAQLERGQAQVAEAQRILIEAEHAAAKSNNKASAHRQRLLELRRKSKDQEGR